MARRMKVPQGFEALAELGLYDCGLTEEQIKFLDSGTFSWHACSTWTVNPDTGLVDIDGDFSYDGYCHRRKLTDFKGIRFGKVTGDFDCRDNKLTSLEGAPEYVGGWFQCSNNKLTSLHGAPKQVGGSVDCVNNKLTSLQGAPKEVGCDFDCRCNKLTSLEGAPEQVGGNFNCSYNELTSLVGAPREVGGWFDCLYNKLTSLEGMPTTIGGEILVPKRLKDKASR